jgi:uncharacterized protein YndB with AHSA1/START domain
LNASIPRRRTECSPRGRTRPRRLDGSPGRPPGHELDFQVGGHEIARGTNDAGDALTFESSYHDIVPTTRIVYSSTLSVGDKVITVSVTTVEISAAGDGTRLALTEQGTYLDGAEEPSWREQGTGDQLDALGVELKEMELPTTAGCCRRSWTWIWRRYGRSSPSPRNRTSAAARTGSGSLSRRRRSGWRG